jgi:16S rRNA (uracil1498-N3)-methyltransferase
VLQVNLILFQPAELDRPLPITDPRAQHLLKVLKRAPGDTFDAGVINGAKGKATLTAISGDSLSLAFTWGPSSPVTTSLELIIGMPRPQTARDILRDATTLGVTALHFVATERGDPNYASSTLWSGGEWQRHLITGAEQAFDTHIPTVTYSRTLSDVTAESPASPTRLALDNYESPGALSQAPSMRGSVTLAIGPERGWSPAERVHLRDRGFTLVHLGSRVLRTETAVVAALTLVRAKLGFM